MYTYEYEEFWMTMIILAFYVLQYNKYLYDLKKQGYKITFGWSDVGIFAALLFEIATAEAFLWLIVNGSWEAFWQGNVVGLSIINVIVWVKSV